MIHRALNFFPFDIASGPVFLAFYFLTTIVVLSAAVLLRRIVGSRLDAWVQAPVTASMAPIHPATPPLRRPLTVGWIPQADEHSVIAYLRHRIWGVADVLIV